MLNASVSFAPATVKVVTVPSSVRTKLSPLPFSTIPVTVLLELMAVASPTSKVVKLGFATADPPESRTQTTAEKRSTLRRRIGAALISEIGRDPTRCIQTETDGPDAIGIADLPTKFETSVTPFPFEDQLRWRPALLRPPSL